MFLMEGSSPMAGQSSTVASVSSTILSSPISSSTPHNYRLSPPQEISLLRHRVEYQTLQTSSRAFHQASSPPPPEPTPPAPEQPPPPAPEATPTPAPTVEQTPNLTDEELKKLAEQEA